MPACALLAEACGFAGGAVWLPKASAGVTSWLQYCTGHNGPGARAGKRSTESRLSFFKLTLCIQSFSHHPTLIATPAQDHKAYLHASKLFMRPPTLKDAHTHNTMITSHVKLRSRARVNDQHRSQSYSTCVVVRQNRPLETARLSETSRPAPPLLTMRPPAPPPLTMRPPAPRMRPVMGCL